MSIGGSCVALADEAPQLLPGRLVRDASPCGLPGPLRTCLSDSVSSPSWHRCIANSLRRTASLPVRYVFPKRSLDVKSVAEALYTTAFPDGKADADDTLEDDALPEDREARGKKGVVVFWDVAYNWIEGT